MRRTPNSLLFAAALLASGSCLAQQASTDAVAPAPANAAAPASVPSPASATRNAGHPRSAFGKVIGIMIASLQHPAPTASDRPASHVETSAAGTPLDIEVGDAFRIDAAPAASKPTEYAVQQPAMAGPG